MYVIIDITMESSFDSDVGIFQNSAFVLQLKVLRGGRGGGGLATAFDLAAIRLSMIAPVKKSVNRSRTAASMRETC